MLVKIVIIAKIMLQLKLKKDIKAFEKLFCGENW
jgi:hypothetical protein